MGSGLGLHSTGLLFIAVQGRRAYLKVVGGFAEHWSAGTWVQKFATGKNVQWCDADSIDRVYGMQRGYLTGQLTAPDHSGNFHQICCREA